MQETLKARDITMKPSRWATLQKLFASFSRKDSTTRSDNISPGDEVPAEVVSLQRSDDVKSAILAPSLQYTFPEASFDCCVDTFGLCSCTDPVKALIEMSRVRICSSWKAAFRLHKLLCVQHMCMYLTYGWPRLGGIFTASSHKDAAPCRLLSLQDTSSCWSTADRTGSS